MRKDMTVWCWQRFRAGVAILFSILLGICLLQVILKLCRLEDIRIISGCELAFGITFFVFGIVCFGETLRFGLVMGVSRRSVFWSMTALVGMMGLLTTAMEELLYWLSRAAKIETSVFDLLFSGYQAGPGLRTLMRTAFTFTEVICALAVGYFIGAVFYRLGQRGRVLWAVGLPVGMCVLIPLAVEVLPAGVQKALYEAIVSFFGFVAAFPLRLAGVFLLGAGVFMGINWLLVRRAPLK